MSMTTGVSGTEMNAVYQSLGIDPNDVSAHSYRDSILAKAGYTRMTKGYYDNDASGAADEGAKILYERYKKAPTTEQIEAAGLNPSQVSVVNSNQQILRILDRRC